MKISVITIVKNNEKTIRQAIESTLAQKNIDLEYIVLDGKSTDNTLNIINEYKEKISVIISEADKGIYHALNKGIALATGDIVAILNSDDIYASDTVLADVVNAFKKGYSVVYGDLAIVKSGEDRKVVRYWHSGHYKKYKVYFGWMPPHPSFFVKRELYEKYGCFDPEMRIASDYDLMLRFMTKDDVSCYYLSKLIVKMRTGGVSNNSFGNLYNKIYEDYRVVKRHNLVGLFTVFMKKARKIHQYMPVNNKKIDE